MQLKSFIAPTVAAGSCMISFEIWLEGHIFLEVFRMSWVTYAIMGLVGDQEVLLILCLLLAPGKTC